MSRESFVFHAEYLNDLPEEHKATYALYVFNYAIYGTIPELTGFEKTVWIKIQRRIDHDFENWEETKQARSNAGKNHTGNQYTRKKEQSGTKWNKMEQCSNSYEKMEQNGTNGTVNVSVSVNESENEFVNGDESVIDKPVIFSPQPAPLVLPENYATEVFNLYTEAGLPNCQGNFIFFLQRDFKFALEVLHTKPDLRGLHSDMVLGAIKNYIAVLNNPDTWKGWKNKKSFDSFVSWERFKDFLPDRFVLDNFLEHTATPPPQTQTKGVGREEALRILHEELANGKKNSS